MTSDTLSRWLTLAANIGVLIGLVLLIIEARHAIDVSESEAYRNRGTEIQEAFKELALSADLAAIAAKADDQGIDSLTRVEFVRWSAWNRAAILRMQMQFHDYQLGYLDAFAYQAMLRKAAMAYLRWQELGIDPEDFDPRFIRAVEAERAAWPDGAPPNQSVYVPTATQGGNRPPPRE